MALVKCKDCGTEISTQARTCPKCGRPAGGHALGVVLLLAFAGALIWGGVTVLRGGTSGTPTVASSPSSTGAEWPTPGARCFLYWIADGQPAKAQVPLFADETSVNRYRAALAEKQPAEATKQILRFAPPGTEAQVTAVTPLAVETVVFAATFWIDRRNCQPTLSR